MLTPRVPSHEGGSGSYPPGPGTPPSEVEDGAVPQRGARVESEGASWEGGREGRLYAPGPGASLPTCTSIRRRGAVPKRGAAAAGSLPTSWPLPVLLLLPPSKGLYWPGPGVSESPAPLRLPPHSLTSRGAPPIIVPGPRSTPKGLKGSYDPGPTSAPVPLATPRPSKYPRGARGILTPFSPPIPPHFPVRPPS